MDLFIVYILYHKNKKPTRGWFFVAFSVNLGVTWESDSQVGED